MITNYAWLDGLSYTGMRERYLESFDRILVDSLNGDKYRTGKLTPAGEPDPSVFSTEWNREGIQVGTAVSTLIRKEQHVPCERVEFRDYWGTDKRQALRRTEIPGDDHQYVKIKPILSLGLPFVPLRNDVGYDKWPAVPSLLPTFFPGIQTARDAFLVDIDPNELKSRIEVYFDRNVTNQELAASCPAIMRDTGRYDASVIRQRLHSKGIESGQYVRYCYRPFDVRWLYWHPETKLLDEKRTEFFNQVFGSNMFLVTQQKPRRDWSCAQAVRNNTDLVLMDRGASCFPLLIRKETSESGLFRDAIDPNEIQSTDGSVYNLSADGRRYLDAIQGLDEPWDLFRHCLAILNSARYAEENPGALRQDWPRIPLPASRELLRHSSGLGQKLVGLFDSENPVRGVTSNPIRAELKLLGTVSRVGGGGLSAEDLALSVG